MTDRRLLIVRHAKTEQQAPSDHARRLTDRGHRDAAAGVRWLEERGHRPDKILVSSAARAQQTAQILADGLGVSDVSVDETLYQAGVQDVLDACVAVDGDPSTLMVVGHNPTMADVAHVLSGDDVYEDMSTAGIAVFDVDGPWSGLSPERTTAVDRHTPRG